MILTRVELWHWQGLDHALLEDLSPSLNLVLGPNESGKSRLFRAIQFALFESHKGAAARKKATQGWGRFEPPRVEVHFEAAGCAYRIEKQFLKSAHAVLEGGGRLLRDRDADEALAELLGLGGPQGRKASADHLGFWPLLWVEQLGSSRPPHEDVNDATRARLRDILTAEIGEVTAGPAGDRILRKVREEASRYWTATGRPTGLLREAAERRDEAETALRQARAQKERLVDVSGRLADAELRLAGLADRLETRRAALTQAQGRAEGAREARERLDRQASAVQLAEERLRSAQGAWKLRQERESALADLGAQVETARKRLVRLQGEVEARTTALSEADARLKKALTALDRAQEELRRANREVSRNAAAQSVQGLEARLAQVAGMRRELTAVAKSLADISVTRDSVKALESALGAWDRARAKLEGASAHVRLRALRDLQLPEGPLPAGVERTWVCSERRTIRIEGLAEIDVSPGGTGLSNLQTEERQARRDYESLLVSCRVESLQEAQTRWEARQQLETRARIAGEHLRQVCPEGETLLEASLERARKALADLGPEDPTAPTVEVAEAERGRLGGAAKEVSSEREALAAGLARTREEAAGQESRVRNLEAEALRLERLLQGMAPVDVLERGFRDAERAWGETLGLRDELQRRFEEAGGELAREDEERARKAFDELEAERKRSEAQRLELRGELSAFREEAVHENEQEAETVYFEAERRLAEIQRRANGAKRLFDALDAARRGVQERLAAPVAEAVQPYLRQIFPGSRLALSEGWEVTGLATGNLSESFDELSGGAREQLSIMVRLGLAELFAGDDRLPIILDDAMTNTDHGRLERLHAILYAAARRLQVIVLTCHEEAFDGLGADRRFVLRATRPSSSAPGGVRGGPTVSGDGQEATGGGS